MQNTTTKIRRLAAATVLSIGLGAVARSPVAADAPTTVVDSWTFTDINPCSGAEHEITLNADITVHEHQNNVVVHLARTGSTDDGYVMNHSVETFVENSNVARGSLTDQWRNPDGSKYRVNGHYTINFNKGEMVAGGFTMSCLGS